MNPRSVLVIIAAILVPGGVLLLAPLIYRWFRQRKALRTTLHDPSGPMMPPPERLQAALPDRP